MRRRNAPAFERGQLAQLDPPKPMIAKRAQQRILLESGAQRLRIERPNTPSQPGAPPTRTATTSRHTRIPRDEQRAVCLFPTQPPKKQPAINFHKGTKKFINLGGGEVGGKGGW